jgi:hypothetical protein
VYIRAAPKQLLKFNRLAIAKAMPASFLVLSGLSIGPCGSPFSNGVIHGVERPAVGLRDRSAVGKSGRALAESRLLDSA